MNNTTVLWPGSNNFQIHRMRKRIAESWTGMLMFFMGCLFLGCSNSAGTSASSGKGEEVRQMLTGYVAFEETQGYFVDCGSKKLYHLADNTTLEKLRSAYDTFRTEGTWVYAELTVLTGDKEWNNQLSELIPERYDRLSGSEFCEGDIIFFSLANRFLDIEKGVNVADVGKRYGPVIFTKPKAGGGNYTDMFDMHTVKKTALVSFFTDDKKNIMHYEVRDPDIFLVNGVHTGMLFKEVKDRIPDLKQENIARYGMTVAVSEALGLSFIFTEDFDDSRKSTDDIDPQSRLYLIRY